MKQVRTEWLKRALSLIARTPLHPQWLIFRRERASLESAASKARGLLLDIGCADKPLKAYLGEKVEYIGLDFPGTVETMYHTSPDIFGDAQCLPIADHCLDTVILLEVLEHLPRVQAALMEIKRVMKYDGVCLLSMPFLYPVHDAPFDFQRFTIYGLKEALAQAGLEIRSQQPIGTPVETAMILLNLAYAKTVLGAIQKRRPMLLLGVPLPILVLLNNLIGWLFSFTKIGDEFMPHGHLLEVVVTRP